MEKTIFNGDTGLSDLEHRELVNAKELIEKGKFDEAFQLLNDFGEKKDLSRYERTSYFILMSSIFINLGKKEEMFDYVEKACQAIQGQKNSLQVVDVYLVKITSYLWKFKHDKAFNLILKSENLCNTLTKEPLNELLKRKATIAWLNEIFYSVKGQFDKALDYAEQSLRMREKLDLKADIVMTLSLIKEIYQSNGDFDKALDYTEQGLKIAKEMIL